MTPGGDPLAPLLEPLDAQPLSSSGDAVQVRATYPAAALGLAGTDPVAVTITVAPDGAVTARYTTTVNGVEATSETLLVPTPTGPPIVAPSPSARPAPSPAPGRERPRRSDAAPAACAHQAVAGGA